MSALPEPQIPMAVWEGTFTLLGVPLRCVVLDNGQRVINSEDVAMLFQAMARGDAVMDAAEVECFARWRSGL